MQGIEYRQKPETGARVPKLVERLNKADEWHTCFVVLGFWAPINVPLCPKQIYFVSRRQRTAWLVIMFRDSARYNGLL